MSRLANGGLIDRDISRPFTFDGQAYTAHPGDTLASALLAQDVRLMGRSFKYHRPRGVLTAGSEEPNALMEIGVGAARTPNTRATTQEVYAGLVAQSQNCFPSLKTDFLAVNDLLAPFLGAGFYYKTFMWPKAFWEKLYEPIIRRAAGLGRLSGEPDQTLYQKAHAHCDLLVIGAGPAGLMAASVAAKGGAKVILADEDFILGGRLNSEDCEINGQSGQSWAAKAVAELKDMPNVTVMARTTITGAYDGGTYGALERVADHIAQPNGAPTQIFWRIVTKRAILASGAHERPIAFPNNDRPGIMLASALRTYVTRFGVTPGHRIAVFTNNDDGWRTVRDLQAAGVSVIALIDTRPEVTPDVDCPVYTGAKVVNTAGRRGVERLSLRKANGALQQVNADCLAVSGGWNPALHLSSHMGGRPEWRANIAAFVPKPGAIPNLVAVGAANGAFSTHAALSDGMIAAKSVLKDLGLKQVRPKLPLAEDAPIQITPFWHVSGEKGRAWLDFQNDVTVKDIKTAHAENFRSVEHMKRYTTLGMATDQGKLSNMGALAIMAELTGQSIPKVGTTIFRPPYTPVHMGALGAGGAGKGFQPERFPPAHDFMAEKTPHMIEAGLWYRPAYYPQNPAHHWRDSCDREVNMVRSSVGVCDVTTLGKIDVQGADAAEFLDRVYTNMISTLKPGRVRYALMLREDGFVLDDGTVARLVADHFVITTTTGAAGAVLSHLEFCAQCLWAELDVQIISVTEQWAQYAVAGPQSRALLADLLDTDISDAAIPYMGWMDITLGGIKGRLFRISFSGELAYEIALPARFGDALMRELDARAKAMGGGLYGLEALNVLRIEKGFLTHAEMDGRVVAADLGMSGMLSGKKDFIGKIASQRAGLIDPMREQLVGIRPIGVVRQLLGGSIMVDVGADATRENVQGYISSACYSPTLGGMIAMAFVKGGRTRIGAQIRAVDLVRDLDTLCEIVPVQFHDPEGGKLRG
ncbi:MAG: sarcosine oxidase subunit alpha family protein [Paracoccaceae bacterium]